MKEQDFSIKERLQQKSYCSDIYQPYGCSKPSLINKIHPMKITSN
jgi:hypothetical protein